MNNENKIYAYAACILYMCNQKTELEEFFSND